MLNTSIKLALEKIPHTGPNPTGLGYHIAMANEESIFLEMQYSDTFEEGAIFSVNNYHIISATGKYRTEISSHKQYRIPFPPISQLEIIQTPKHTYILKRTPGTSEYVNTDKYRGSITLLPGKASVLYKFPVFNSHLPWDARLHIVKETPEKITIALLTRSQYSWTQQFNEDFMKCINEFGTTEEAERHLLITIPNTKTDRKKLARCIEEYIDPEEKITFMEKYNIGCIHAHDNYDYYSYDAIIDNSYPELVPELIEAMEKDWTKPEIEKYLSPHTQ